MGSIYRLGQGTVVSFRGPDRWKVLNNLATQDLRELSTGSARETFITDPKGKTYGHGIALGLADALLFITVPDQASRLVPHFDRFIIMEDATVEDVSDRYALWLGEDPSLFSGVSEGTGLLVPAPWIGKDSVLWLTETSVSTESVAKRTGHEVIVSDLKERDAWELNRIEAFWPWYGLDFDERNLPQELDRDELAISFNKGCYLGQETIARLDALGQVQKKLVRLDIDSSAKLDREAASTLTLYSPGSEEAQGVEVGSLRSFAKDGQAGFQGLAFVKRSHFEIGTELKIGEARCRVRQRLASM